MKLTSTRTLAGLKPVLKDPSSTGPDPVYWVFGDIGEDRWANITITAPGILNGECPKTFGHYHSTAVDESYHLIGGKGVLILQKKHMENGSWVPNQVDEVLLIRAKAGDEIKITPEYGHSWSNTGDLPLISFDDWRAGHQPADYEPIEKLQGMAYYLIKEGGELKAIPNPKYQNLPQPTSLTAEEFKNRGQTI